MECWASLAAEGRSARVAGLCEGTIHMISLVKSLGTILGIAAADLSNVVSILGDTEPTCQLEVLKLTPPLVDALTRECWLLECEFAHPNTSLRKTTDLSLF